MSQFIVDNFRHVLCLLILLGRVGDIVSTYLVTPTLRLEGNWIVRRLGWRFAILSTLLCLVPYYDTALGVVVLVPSLLVSASNTGKIWFVRAMGESEYADLILRLARRSSLWQAVAVVLCSSALVGLAAMVLLFLCPDPERDWGYWFGIGIAIYAGAIALHGTIFSVRLFKKAKGSGPASAL